MTRFRMVATFVIFYLLIIVADVIQYRLEADPNITEYDTIICNKLAIRDPDGNLVGMFTHNESEDGGGVLMLTTPNDKHSSLVLYGGSKYEGGYAGSVLVTNKDVASIFSIVKDKGEIQNIET